MSRHIPPVPRSSPRKRKTVTEFAPHRPPARIARGILKDELFITGDIIGPIDVEWDALKMDPPVKPAGDV
jgi:hypothetical protein